MDTRSRYQNDPEFKAIVDAFEDIITYFELTPPEVDMCVQTALIHYAEKLSLEEK